MNNKIFIVLECSNSSELHYVELGTDFFISFENIVYTANQSQYGAAVKNYNSINLPICVPIIVKQLENEAICNFEHINVFNKYEPIGKNAIIEHGDYFYSYDPKISLYICEEKELLKIQKDL